MTITNIVGHRGARNLWPENSITGFRNVFDLAIEVVEFDVHLSDAGELLVIHDPTLERTTEGQGQVRALTPAARAELRLKDLEEGIPTLDDVLTVVTSKQGLQLLVEIKVDVDGQLYPGLPARVIEVLESYDCAGRCHLTSFDPATLEECRRLAPQIPRLLTVNNKSMAQIELARALQLADKIGFQMELLETEWDAITAKIPLEQLLVWAPNTREELEKWLGRGLGQIATDRPDLALAVRERLANVAS
ncbi:glycerophosphodiester phosphodiesterase family protein [uncultured Planktomarina sp.]|jgi:glycerophosphoryl diester phosphodiesterase|uniref:glycerophosphodiester phosphodiesterase family protein n=1 Tax=uncultured Planktomarina sp. TaxID=1538529 RepID=UPI003261992C